MDNKITKKVEDYIKENFPEYWELHLRDSEKFPIYPELIKSLKHRYGRKYIKEEIK